MNHQADSRNDFLNYSDELNYLNEMIQSHIQGQQLPGADIAHSLHRFRDLLEENGADNGSIMIQDHWAVLHESEGNFCPAIDHRILEIERIERLFSIGGPVGTVNANFLIQCLEKLHENYLQIGKMADAAEVYQRIQRLLDF